MNLLKKLWMAIRLRRIDRIIKTVRKLAEKYPDAIYRSLSCDNHNGCFYDKGSVQNGPEEEGCIFGHALRQNGVYIPPEWVGDIDRLLRTSRIKATTEQLKWCKKVQQRQDRGDTWSQAVRMTDVSINKK